MERACRPFCGLQAGPASREDEDRLLQGCEPTRRAEMYNPCIRGWINYYSNFYRTQLRSTLKRIDLYVIRWARRKFKRLRLKTKGARDWFDRLRRTNPTLFAHWQLCHGNGRASGAV